MELPIRSRDNWRWASRDTRESNHRILGQVSKDNTGLVMSTVHHTSEQLEALVYIVHCLLNYK